LKVKDEYNKLVNKLMCAPDVCDCPQEEDVVSLWSAIPEEELRSFDRIASAADYNATETEALFT
jgi:hypothetical protein